MNIFAISDDPKTCAKFLDDLRLNKMILETAQILSSALIKNGYVDKDSLLYKPTHLNHPCVKWAAESVLNFEWLCDYGFELHTERKCRFPDKPDHKSFKVIKTCFAIFPRNSNLFATYRRLPFVNCARNKALRLDYTGMSNAHGAYKTYLEARWFIDKTPPKWTNAKDPRS